MKGKKHCSSCSAIVPARAASCLCGFKFYDKKTVVEKKVPLQEAGKGRKQCPECSIFSGVRTAKCQCGHDFTTVPAKAPKFTGPRKVYAESGNEPEAAKFSGDQYNFLVGTIENRHIASKVLVPAGLPPSQIKDYSEEGILAWARELFANFYYQKQGACLTNEAMLYFFKQNAKNEDKYEFVKNVLDKNVCMSFFV